MKMNESLNRILKSTQKISESIVAFNKITNIQKANPSFLMNFDELQKYSNTLSNNHKYYGGGKAIPLAFESGRTTNEIVSVLSKHPKLYGNGDMIHKIIDFGINSDSLKLSLDTLNSVVKSNNKVFFNSLDSLKGSDLNTLDYLKTVKLISKKNLLIQTKRKEEITEKISGLLYTINDFSDLKLPDVANINSSNLRYTSEISIANDYFLNFEFFNYINEFIKCEIEIEKESSKINSIEKISISIKSGIRKFTLNKREFFRKINSFHFKNLDDYDSLALITSVN